MVAFLSSSSMRRLPCPYLGREPGWGTSDGTRRECRRADGPGESSHTQPQINVGLPDLASQLARGEQRPRSFVSGLREQLLRWPLLDHHTLIHDDDAVSDLPGESHLMGHDHHGGPGRADAADRL